MASLANCERRIEGYRKSRNEASAALLEIHGLFEKGDPEVSEYSNFIDYCEQRWGFQKSYAYSLINHGKFLLAHKGNGAVVPNEKQLQTLKAVQLSRPEKKQGIDVWEKRAHAWDEITEERGPDIDPNSLKQELHQRRDIVPMRRMSEKERQAQKDRAVRRQFTNLWKAFADLPIDPEEAAARHGEHIFSDEFEEAYVYMLRLGELRGG